MWHISTVRFVNVYLEGMEPVFDSMEQSMRDRLKADGCIHVSSARYFDGDTFILASSGYNDSEEAEGIKEAA